jgi:pimeloyl-ACP methyl ester carboxylesterase
MPAICPPSIRRITLYNGCTIAYTDEGEGRDTLVFIHGLGAYSGTWQKNTAALRQHFRCIAIDLPGNGHSATGDFPYTMDFFAHCLIDFIGRMNLRRVTLAGHSMGGQIALTAALLLPACCDRLVLCAPAGFETFSAHERLLYKASLDYLSWLSDHDQHIKHLVRTSFYRLPKDALSLEHKLSAMARRQPARHYKMMTDRCIAAMLAEPVIGRLHLVEQPVLTIFGEQDALIPNTLLHPVSTRRLAESGVRKLRHGTLHMIRNCGHFVQWECAARVNSLITDWMRQQPA